MEAVCRSPGFLVVCILECGDLYSFSSGLHLLYNWYEIPIAADYDGDIEVVAHGMFQYLAGHGHVDFLLLDVPVFHDEGFAGYYAEPLLSQIVVEDKCLIRAIGEHFTSIEYVGADQVAFADEVFHHDSQIDSEILVDESDAFCNIAVVDEDHDSAIIRVVVKRHVCLSVESYIIPPVRICCF